MRKRNWISVLLAACVLYGMGVVLGNAGQYTLSGISILAEAVILAVWFWKKNQRFLDMEALFSLFWLGGVGLSALKLSYLATEWTASSWISFAGVHAMFILGYEGMDAWMRRRRGKQGSVLLEDPLESVAAGTQRSSEAAAVVAKSRSEAGILAPKKSDSCRIILILAMVTTAVSLAAFGLEAVVLGFVPLFSSEPHAYSYFHLSGVHYFTVTCVLVPALVVVYFMRKRKDSPEGTFRSFVFSCRENRLALLTAVVSLLIPVLIVSRFQLIFAVGLAVITWMSMIKKPNVRVLIALLLIMIPAYVGLTVARNHDVEYLNGIFEMKNTATPIFITQPYMYVANNFDNFNCLTIELPEHTGGLRMAFPVLVFTGQKFRHMEWVDFPLYVTKEELTTLTLIYDAYYDFGVPGVLGFGLILGLLSCLIFHLTHTLKNPVAPLLYGQALLYLIFSFFSTWYSNPTTWFYYGVTVLYMLVLLLKKAE